MPWASFYSLFLKDFMRLQVGELKKSNLDKSEVQPSPFDKLRAGSSGLGLEMEFPHTLSGTVLLG